MNGRKRSILYALRFEAATGLTIKELTGRTFVYGTLRALERAGFLVSFEREEAMRTRGGRPRRYYALSSSGRSWIDSRKNMRGTGT